MNDSPHVIEINEFQFQDAVLQAPADQLMVVDFWAPWCEPCKALTPILHGLAARYEGRFTLVKINLDENQHLAGQLGVKSVPTVKIIRGGQLLDEFTGALPEGDIVAMLDRHLPHPSDGLRQQAREALSAGDAARAAELLVEAASLDPEVAEIRLEQAQVLASQGDNESALTLIDSLPPELRDGEHAQRLRAALAFVALNQDAPSMEALLQTLANSPEDREALYQLAARHVVAQQYSEALELYMRLLRLDREFREDGARKAILAVFDLVDDTELIRRYRRELASALN
jgi:putative thioredoxin